MKQLFFLFLLIMTIRDEASAQEKAQQFMQITTVESVVGGGMGRSKMIITNADGSQQENDLDNLFSIAGINFKNIKSNENIILSTLKTYTSKGWKLLSTTPLTLSPTQGGQGIFLTRYLLVKEEN